MPKKSVKKIVFSKSVELKKTNSQAHGPGSFEKRRPLSIFHGLGIHNGYLKPYDEPIFEENFPRAVFGPVLPPQQIRGLKGGKITILFQ